MSGEIAQLVEPRHVNPEVAGSSPALVNFSLFIQNFIWKCTQSVSLVVYYMTNIFSLFQETESFRNFFSVFLNIFSICYYGVVHPSGYR